MTPTLLHRLPMREACAIGAAGDAAAAALANGRYEQVVTYGEARAALGFPAVTDWEDVLAGRPAELVARLVPLLQGAWPNASAADAWIGAILEWRPRAAGEVLARALWMQLQHARASDPFWYEATALLRNATLVQQVKATRLGDILARNLPVGYLPSNVFVVTNTRLAEQELCGERGEPCEQPTAFQAQLTSRYSIKWQVRGAQAGLRIQMIAYPPPPAARFATLHASALAGHLGLRRSTHPARAVVPGPRARLDGHRIQQVPIGGHQDRTCDLALVTTRGPCCPSPRAAWT